MDGFDFGDGPSSGGSGDHASAGASSGGYTFNAKHASISIIPHFTGLLSVLGSLFIILDILHPRNRAQKTTRVYSRLLLGMSLSDLSSSVAMALSTWPIPSGTKVYGASGTQGTCTAQGFFVQMGAAAPLYNAFLALYYLLVVRYNWSETHGRMIAWERRFHVAAWLLAIGTSLSSIGLELYNSANLWCWIAPLPNDCVNSSKSPDGTTTCLRGDNAYIYRIAFYFLWLWSALIVVTVAMGLVVHTVWDKARKSRKMDARTKLTNSIQARRRSSTVASRRRSSGGLRRSSGMAAAEDDAAAAAAAAAVAVAAAPKPNKTAQDKQVSRVSTQAALYVGAFYLTAVFPSVVRMFQAKWNCTSTFYPLSVLTVTFYPTQGFWNFFIYVRPRYLKYRRDHPDRGRLRAARATVGKTLGLLFRRNGGSKKERTQGSTEASSSGATNPLGSEGSTTVTSLSKSVTRISRRFSSSLMSRRDSLENYMRRGSLDNCDNAAENIPEERQEEQDPEKQQDDASGTSGSKTQGSSASSEEDEETNKKPQKFSDEDYL